MEATKTEDAFQAERREAESVKAAMEEEIGCLRRDLANAEGEWRAACDREEHGEKAVSALR